MSIEQNFPTKTNCKDQSPRFAQFLFPGNTAVKNVTNTYASICVCIHGMCKREMCTYNIERLSGSIFVSQNYFSASWMDIRDQDSMFQVSFKRRLQQI